MRRAERDRAAAEATAAEEANTRREAEARAAEQRKRKRVQLVATALLAGLASAAFAGQQWYERREERRRNESERASERADADRRAAEARSKAEQARRGVTAGLEFAPVLRRQYKFKEAGDALPQALELARGGAPERVDEVERARRDRAFVIELDGIRYRKFELVAPAGSPQFDKEGTPTAYREAFAHRGWDLTTLDPPKAARLISASNIKDDVVAAVDD